MTDLAAVILAGGSALRFGGEKASFPVEGRPMLTRVYDALAPVVEKILISVQRPEQAPESLEFVLDAFPDRGPLAGIDAGLAAVDATWLLVVACDMPYLTSDSIRLLLEARSEHLDAVVACDSAGRLHPLCACYRTSIRGTVRDRLERGLLSLHGLIEALPNVAKIPLPDSTLANINEKPDLR